jgi:hypothetical protein
MSITDYSKFDNESEGKLEDQVDYLFAITDYVSYLERRIEGFKKHQIADLENFTDYCLTNLSKVKDFVQKHSDQLKELDKAGCEPVEVEALHKLVEEFPSLFIHDDSSWGGLRLHITGESWVAKDYDTIRSFLLTAKDHKENTIKFSSITKNEDGSFVFQFVADSNGIPEKALKNPPNPFHGRQVQGDTPYFHKAKVGDNVRHTKYGNGKIIGIKLETKTEFPIVVDFYDIDGEITRLCETFTLDGSLLLDEPQSLFYSKDVKA